MLKEPKQPDEKDWQFVKELQTPLHQKIDWKRHKPKNNEAYLGKGVSIKERFKDSLGVLKTAYKDFNRFLDMGSVKRNGPYQIITARIKTRILETYRIVVTSKSCKILANDTEGIRRGLIYIEDEMLRAGGPFLHLGTIERKPVILTRISRCFFGPIKRPPKNRDELLDNVNYYPDEYLNRLAHDGINGLWLTITFKDLCHTSIIPEYGQDAKRRLKKLEEIVKVCARYGIRIYVFCIEPAAFPEESPILKKHPELGGHRSSDGRVYFCASSKIGREYIEEATYNLFSSVPDLGGLINISVGERATLCPNGSSPNNCPRCSKREPWEVLADSLSSMERGIHRASPKAELISWLYVPELNTASLWSAKALEMAAAHTPKNVIFQYNFESSGRKKQLGKWQTANDYFLSYIGPGGMFHRCAKAGFENKRRISAKLQVGCSHEVASVPFVPVPGNLYKKYKKMHELGVSSAMQCWYFGNYPSIMTKAAEELSFAPFPESEDEFLLKLARRDWGENAVEVVKAWKYFQKGYRNYPLNNIFGYYGPMHDGPVWPLYLEPRDLPLAPTWQICYPPSGDRIGECITYTHTFEEVLTLCNRIKENWIKGVNILQKLKPFYKDNPERIKNIGVAEALGIQFQSCLNILNFYALREKLAWDKKINQLAVLDQMKAIVHSELVLDKKLLKLAESDSRLGFHSEAEGYKYFPAKIRWRMKQLEKLLKKEFPAVEKRIKNRLSVFPHYTGEKPQGPVYKCKYLTKAPELKEKSFNDDVWKNLSQAECKYNGYYKNRRAFWKAGYDKKAIYFSILCENPKEEQKKESWQDDLVEIVIEPRRLWSSQLFRIKVNGSRSHTIFGGKENYQWKASVCHFNDKWSATVKIPFACLDNNATSEKAIRINIGRRIYREGGKREIYRWIAPHMLLKPRLGYGADNPADLGWLVFDKFSKKRISNLTS